MTSIIMAGRITNNNLPGPPPPVCTPQLMSLFSSKTFESRPRAKCRPTGIFIAPNGDFIVCDYIEKVIKIFNKMGQVKGCLGKGELKRPWNAVLMSNGNIAVSDPGNTDIKVFTMKGDYVKSFDFARHLQEPYGLGIDRNGEVLVADKGANCVYFHNSDGFMLGSIKGVEDRPLIFWPQYVCCDNNNNIIVSDYVDHCVKGFDRQGRCLFKHGSMGPGDDQLMCPQGVCVDAYGHIIVADSANERIKLLNPDGTLKQILLTAKNGLGSPEAVAVTQDGMLVVTEGGSGDIKILKYLS